MWGTAVFQLLINEEPIERNKITSSSNIVHGETEKRLKNERNKLWIDAPLNYNYLKLRVFENINLQKG